MFFFRYFLYIILKIACLTNVVLRNVPNSLDKFINVVENLGYNEVSV